MPVIFENPGVIDPAAICTFGVSVKESENPIGFFGTGLKYAIAICLRHGLDVEIWAGQDRLVFTAEPEVIRGQTFSVVCMNGQRLGFTTDVGKTWDLWMAYRELFCNARDESGDARLGQAEPSVDSTQVVITGRAFELVHQDRSKYFMEEEPDFEIAKIQVWRRPSQYAFYRGVRAAVLSRPALFTYNILESMELSEDRTLKDTAAFAWRLGSGFKAHGDCQDLRRVLTADRETFESTLWFGGFQEPSPEFCKTVEELVEQDIAALNGSARQVLEALDKKPKEPKALRLSAVQAQTLQRAVDFCKKIGFPVDSFPIQVAESLGTNVLGLAYNRTIFVSQRAFEIGGAKQVSVTLIEEYVHLRFDLLDCTRDLQNWLFEKLVSFGEEMAGQAV